jgi:hypothetical protein
MLLRGMLIGVWVAALSSCGDSAPETPSSSESMALAGSCNFMADGRCDDYAEPQTNEGTARACGDMGGTWDTHQCALTGRAAVCTEASPATRTFAYSTGAATALASSCPEGKLTRLEGACDMPMRGLCDEFVSATSTTYSGLQASTGDAAGKCEMTGGTWTSGGRCAMPGRTASCSPNGPATSTFAYTPAAADKLASSSSCMPNDFKRLGAAPPPTTSEEDAGL